MIERILIRGFSPFINETVVNADDRYVAILGPNGSGKSSLIQAIRYATTPTKSYDREGPDTFVQILVAVPEDPPDETSPRASMISDTSNLPAAGEISDLQMSRDLTQVTAKVTRTTLRRSYNRIYHIDGVEVDEITYKQTLDRLGILEPLLLNPETVSGVAEMSDSAVLDIVEGVDISDIFKPDEQEQETLRYLAADGKAEMVWLRQVQDFYKRKIKNSKAAYRRATARARKRREREQAQLNTQRDMQKLRELIDRQMQAQQEERDRHLDALRQKLLDAEAALAELEAADSSSQELNDLRRQLQTERQLKDENRSKLQDASSRLDDQSKVEETNQRRLQTLKEKLFMSNRLKADNQKTLGSILAEVRHQNDILSKIESKAGPTIPAEFLVAHSVKVDEVKSLILKEQSREVELTEVSSELYTVQRSHEAAARNRDVLEVRVSAQEANIAKVEQKLDGVRERRRELEQTSLRLTAAKTQSDTRLQELLEEAKSSNISLNRVTAETNKLNTIEKLRSQFPGVHKMLSSLITAVEPQYYRAIQAALGRHRTSIVVDDIATATACVAYARDHNLGRYKFLVINAARPKLSRPDSSHLPRDLIYAIDAMKIDPIYEEVALSVVNHAVIAPTMERAVAARRDKTVTTGTIYTHDARVLLRSNILRTKKDAAESDESKLPREFAELKLRAEQIVEEKTQVDNDMTLLETEERDASKRLDALKNELDQSRNELKAHQTSVDRTQSRLSHLTSQDEEKRRKVAQSQETINDTIAFLSKEYKEYCSRHGLSTPPGNAIESYFRNPELNEADSQRTRIEKRRDEQSQEASNLQIALENLARSIETTEGEIATTSSALQESLGVIEELNASIAALRTAETESNDRIEQLLRQISDLEDEHDGSQKKIAELRRAVANARNSVEIDEKRQDHLILHDTDEITQLRTVVALDVPLSHGNAESDTSVDDRILIEQKARSILLGDIAGKLENFEELENKMMELKRETLERSFDLTYREMYGRTARAYIHPTDTENIAAGAVLIVRPSASTEKRIAMLSAGQQVVAGVAFLVANDTLHRGKLVLFDEPDSSLDSACVMRLVGLMKKLGSRMQFLVATHHPVTRRNAEHYVGLYRDPRDAEHSTRTVSIPVPVSLLYDAPLVRKKQEHDRKQRELRMREKAILIRRQLRAREEDWEESTQAGAIQVDAMQVEPLRTQASQSENLQRERQS